MDRKRHPKSRSRWPQAEAAWRLRYTRQLWIVGLVCVILGVVNLPLATSAVRAFSANSGTQSTGVVMPIYLASTNISGSTSLQVAAVIHIDTIKNGFQRRGFFRIGVLPLVALNGFKVEIIDTNRTVEALSKAHQLLKHRIKSASAVEAYDVALLFGSQPQVTINAEVLRFGNEQTWELEEGSITQCSQIRHFNSAVFHLAGKNAGQVSCQEDSTRFRLQVAQTTKSNTSNNEHASNNGSASH